MSSIYPLAAIDDPSLALSLDEKQTIWTTVDALVRRDDDADICATFVLIV